MQTKRGYTAGIMIRWLVAVTIVVTMIAGCGGGGNAPSGTQQTGNDPNIITGPGMEGPPTPPGFVVDDETPPEPPTYDADEELPPPPPGFD